MPHFICSPILCLTIHSLKKTPCVLHIWWHMCKKTPWVLSIWCHMCKKPPWVLNISCIMERSHYVFADDSFIIAEWRFFLLAGCWVTADWMEVENTSCIFCFAQGCSYAYMGMALPLKGMATQWAISSLFWSQQRITFLRKPIISVVLWILLPSEKESP